jgi:hypothetical protein
VKAIRESGREAVHQDPSDARLKVDEGRSPPRLGHAPTTRKAISYS